MAYKFQLGDTLMSGSLYQTGSFKILDDDGSLMVDIARDTGNIDTTGTITCDDSITIDSITITDTELGYLDGLTLGTAAASKVLTLDASKNVATIGTVGCGAITSTGASSYGTLTGGNLSGSGTLQIVGNAFLGGTLNVTGNADFNGTITCDDSITIDSITITDTEFGYLDGLTLGTVAGSKVVTADANKDFSGHRNISGSGTLQAVGNAFLGGTLNVTGATTIAGATSLNGAVTLGDATGDDLTFTGLQASNLVPKTDSTYDLGSNSNRYANIYVDSITGATVALTVEARNGGQTISSATGFALITAGNGVTVTLPAASAGKELTVKLSSSIGDVILNAAAGDLVENQANIRLQSTGSAVKLTAYDAQSWFVS